MGLAPCPSAVASQPFLTWCKGLLQRFAGATAALPAPFPATQQDTTAKAELWRGGQAFTSEGAMGGEGAQHCGPSSTALPRELVTGLPSPLLEAFLAVDGQVPGEVPLPAQQWLVGLGSFCAMHCAWTNQDGQFWPRRCWKKGSQGDLQQLTACNA